MSIRCINCGFPCQKYGKTNAGSQRWYCNQYSYSFTNKVNKTNNNLQMFFNQQKMFVYLLRCIVNMYLSVTNNRIEGGVNAQLRTMLRNIPTWGDVIVWSDLHNCALLFSNLWD